MFMLHTFFSLPTLTAHLFALVTSVVFAKTHLSSSYYVRAKIYDYRKDTVNSCWVCSALPSYFMVTEVSASSFISIIFVSRQFLTSHVYCRYFLYSPNYSLTNTLTLNGLAFRPNPFDSFHGPLNTTHHTTYHVSFD